VFAVLQGAANISGNGSSSSSNSSKSAAAAAAAAAGSHWSQQPPYLPGSSSAKPKRSSSSGGQELTHPGSLMPSSLQARSMLQGAANFNGSGSSSNPAAASGYSNHNYMPPRHPGGSSSQRKGSSSGVGQKRRHPCSLPLSSLQPGSPLLPPLPNSHAPTAHLSGLLHGLGSSDAADSCGMYQQPAHGMLSGYGSSRTAAAGAPNLVPPPGLLHGPCSNTAAASSSPHQAPMLGRLRELRDIHHAAVSSAPHQVPGLGLQQALQQRLHYSSTAAVSSAPQQVPMPGLSAQATTDAEAAAAAAALVEIAKGPSTAYWEQQQAPMGVASGRGEPVHCEQPSAASHDQRQVSLLAGTGGTMQGATTYPAAAALAAAGSAAGSATYTSDDGTLQQLLAVPGFQGFEHSGSASSLGSGLNLAQLPGLLQEPPSSSNAAPGSTGMMGHVPGLAGSSHPAHSPALGPTMQATGTYAAAAAAAAVADAVDGHPAAGRRLKKKPTPFARGRSSAATPNEQVSMQAGTAGIMPAATADDAATAAAAAAVGFGIGIGDAHPAVVVLAGQAPAAAAAAGSAAVSAEYTSDYNVLQQQLAVTEFQGFGGAISAGPLGTSLAPSPGLLHGPSSSNAAPGSTGMMGHMPDSAAMHAVLTTADWPSFNAAAELLHGPSSSNAAPGSSGITGHMPSLAMASSSHNAHPAAAAAAAVDVGIDHPSPVVPAVEPPAAAAAAGNAAGSALSASDTAALAALQQMLAVNGYGALCEALDAADWAAIIAAGKMQQQGGNPPGGQQG
jgi:hypothetical protein